MSEFIHKRSGELVVFDCNRISEALQKALLVAGCEIDEAKKIGDDLAMDIKRNVCVSGNEGIPSIEQIQNEAEKALIRNNYAEAAKAYILYRNKHQILRETGSQLQNQLKELFDTSSQESDLKRDNANVDGNCAMGTMLQVGAAASKSYYSENYLTDEQKSANQSGDIHIHDFDFYALTETCCQIDLLRLFEHGFSTGHGYIREPQSIQSYAALACIAIQSNQNDQHGGQSIPNFDYAMADGVRKTFRKTLTRYLSEALENEVWKILCFTSGYTDFHNMAPDTNWAKSLIENVEDVLEITLNLQNVLDEEVLSLMAEAFRSAIFDKCYHVKSNGPVMSADAPYACVCFAVNRTIAETEKATHQAMESLIHNLNSMHSRAGAQTPFSSINYGTDTSPEGRLAIKCVLDATYEGLGNGETPIFPIQIFKVKEGINYFPDDPSYDLFRRACEVSAKRLFPNFSFIDSPFNLQYYVEGHPETEVAYMGCRTRVMGNVYDPATRDADGYHPNGEVAYGRGNLSFTSINLPRLAILAGGDEKKFFDSLEEMMKLTKRQLLDRLAIQSRRHVYNYPFLMGQGVWRGSEKLDINDTVAEVLKNGTLSIGFIGLAEALTALYGHHHGESDEMEQKGLEIIKFMRAYTDEQSVKTGLNFSLLATPAEGLSGYFVRKDKKMFGVIPGVTDKDYYTNSFHVPVGCNISVYDKVMKEAPFHALTNAGHISYVELDGDVANNIEAFESVVRLMHDAGIGYGSINHPVDRDPVCGYVGIIGEVCPRCGRRAGESVSAERLRELRKQYPDMPYHPIET